MHQNYPYSSQDLSSLGVYGSNESYDQLGSWYNPRTWFKKKKKSKPLFWDTGVDIAEGMVKSDLAKKTGKTVFNKVADSNMEVTTTTNTTVNGKKSPTRTTKRNTTPRKEWSNFTSFFGDIPETSMPSLDMYDQTEHLDHFGSWYNPTTWFGGKKKKGKGKASALEDLATNVGKQAAKTATTQATKKATDAIKSKTGIDVSSKDLTSAAKDISKGNISKAATNIGTKVASQAVSKYGAKATTQLSQLTAQYTSALDVPQSSNVGSQSNALMYQSSVPMTANAADSSSSSNDTSSQKETGLSTGAMVGIGVGVLGILGVGGYLLWSAKANKKQKSYGEGDEQIQQQRAIQYQNLQAINNPKAKKSKAKKSKAKKSKAKSCR